MNDMMCPHYRNMVTPEEGDEEPMMFYDYCKFYCPKCGKEL